MAAAAANDGSPMSGREEASAVAAVWASAVGLGQTWCVVDARWFKEWCRYSGFDPAAQDVVAAMEALKISDDGSGGGGGGGARPGPMNNKSLEEEGVEGALRKGMMEGEDYALVIKAVYDLLDGWYGGGPRFERGVIAVGLMREARVDFYPIFLKCIMVDAAGEPDEESATLFPFGSKQTFSDVCKFFARRGRGGDGAADADEKKGEADENKADDDTVRVWREVVEQIEGVVDEVATVAEVEAEHDVMAEAAGADSASDEEGEGAPAPAAAAAAGADAAGGGDADAPAADAPPAAAAAAAAPEEGEAGGGAAAAAADAAGDDKDKDKDKKKKAPRTRTVWRVITGPTLDQPLESFNLPLNSKLLVEHKSDEGEWVRSTVKKNFRDFQIGDVVDAKDTVGKWYESTVRDVNHTSRKVFIHNKRWDKRGDGWMPFDSEDIAMQNTHTEGPYVSRSVGGYFSGGWGYASNEEGTPLQRGAVGLRNLGNTCFMNSTLQCLSMSPVLTEYFLDDTYVSEINRDNALGWGGRVADEYGQLLKDLWDGRYVCVAPVKLKRVLGEVAPRFSGFQQQDSSELLSFLLDGLHEDLNRIIKKPMTQDVESKGRPDKVVAREAWDTYLLRNDSIITRTLQGQLKSRLVCPDCGKVSIKFDPFMFLSVPLPQKKDKAQTVTFSHHAQGKPLTVCMPVLSKVGRIAELKQAVSEMTGVNPRLMVMAEVWSAKLYRFMADDESVSDIGAKDKMFLFEVPEMANHKPHEVYTLQMVHYATSPGRAHRTEAFGLPLPICLPKREDITIGEVRARIDAAVAPFVTKLPAEGTDLHRQVLERRAQRARRAARRKRNEADPEDDMEIDGDGDGDGEGEGGLDGGDDDDDDEERDDIDDLADLPELAPGEKPYRIVLVDNSGRNCSMCDWSAHCAGCVLSDDDAALFNTGPRVVFGIEWTHDAVFFNKNALTTVRHSSAKKKKGGAGAGEGAPKPSDGLDLRQCMTSFTREEVLGENDAWYCSTCKKHQLATKKMDIYRLPDVLIIHLKRFSYSRIHREKISTYVDFPLQGLDMAPFCVDDEEKNTLYDCYAVSNHMGGMGGGHYTAYCKNLINSEWYLHDDSHVRKVDQQDVKGTASYVLFYCRRKPKHTRASKTASKVAGAAAAAKKKE